MLDDYFNHEVRADGTIWHYKWEEKNHGGFYLWGQQFESFGAKLDSLSTAPTAANLANASVYIIVDPDTEKETPKPNFISGTDVKNISAWVKRGGVLVMFGNDFGNAEFDNWNKLAKEFGIEFNKDNKNLVKNDVYEQGRINVPDGNLVFKNARELFLKEISTQKLSGKAKPVLEWKGDVVMSMVKHGKGIVFALGDPWLYNEYTDGRKMNGLFQNFEATRELSAWLLAQAKKK
jgi:unsaturated rhamnogalacturonyl hydrolase